MSHLRSHRGFNPCYFTWGAALLPPPWPEHGVIVIRAYRRLSAPAKLSDLTHSYGQNITVLSRQPTDSKVSALAKSLHSCYCSHGQIMTITSRTPTDDSRLHWRFNTTVPQPCQKGPFPTCSHRKESNLLPTTP